MKNQKTATKSRKQAKTVKVISRIEFKADPRKVVYTVRSSNGSDTYETTLFAGKATGCNCPAQKPCYHMTQLEAKEASRNASLHEEECKCVNQKFNAWSKAHGYAPLPQIVDEAYEEWKRATGKPARMSRDEYCTAYEIY